MGTKFFHLMPNYAIIVIMATCVLFRKYLQTDKSKLKTHFGNGGVRVDSELQSFIDGFLVGCAPLIIHHTPYFSRKNIASRKKHNIFPLMNLIRILKLYSLHKVVL